MTPEELNEKCCRFAGIAPCALCKGLGMISKDSAWVSSGAYQGCYQCNGVPWPPVSTDWGAAGRLMDALSAKGILWRLSHLQEKKCKFALVVDPTSNKHAEASHESAPMALALAVAELADASKA